MIPFHSRPNSSAHLSPAPIPVPPFDLLPINVRTKLPVVESNMVSPSSSVSTSLSAYDFINPVPLEGRVPPFPRPFAAAHQHRDYNLDLEHQPEEPDIIMDPQEQMMAALNRHINTTNDILNRLVDYAANPPAPRPAHTPLFQPLPAFATTSHTPKKYIALPEPFDGNPKNWRVFKGQCHTYLTANADAFATESDKKWFILSHMTKGTAAGIVEWIKGDMRKNFDGKAYETFVDVLDGLLADPTEKQTAHNKLDALRQGNQSIVQFLSEFDVLAQMAGYKTPTHDEFLCHILRMKVISNISDRLFN